MSDADQNPGSSTVSSLAGRYGAARGQNAKFRWRTFITPGWALSVIGIIAFSYLAFSILAPWQLNKDHRIKERNEQILTAFSVDPGDFSTAFAPDGTLNPNKEWYRVEVRGEFIGPDVLLRLRPTDGGPAVQALHAFAIENGPVLLINRGYISTQGNIIPEVPPAPAGLKNITIVARANEPLPAREPLFDDNFWQVYGINTTQVGKVVGTSLGADYGQLTAESPGVLSPIPLPKLDRGSHLSYGMQWIAFGIMAPLGLAYFIRAELKERRQARKELAGQGAIPPKTSAVTVSTPELAETGDPATDLSTPPPPGLFSRLFKADEDAASASTADLETLDLNAARDIRLRYGRAKRNDYERFVRRDEDRF
ncbi:SURF1 family protein [Corynebacterium caspium]|uniref:SURF1 family cytochrome oxidase biogenesis protein n=1 Tax=Corynebacterium caspium TaxID=234828 RepID=UPI000375EAC5|nr:SURF1 family cytochrome oxidase biogenesis protein [Corynebacterium caspium]WKD59670.1 SURF1 family protein [Corynebacterium caspium DSM 44850]